MFPVRSFSLYWLNSVCQLTEAGVWLQLAPGMAGIQAEDTNRERFVMMEQDHPRLFSRCLNATQIWNKEYLYDIHLHL